MNFLYQICFNWPISFLSVMFPQHNSNWLKVLEGVCNGIDGKSSRRTASGDPFFLELIGKRCERNANLTLNSQSPKQVLNFLTKRRQLLKNKLHHYVFFPPTKLICGACNPGVWRRASRMKACIYIYIFIYLWSLWACKKKKTHIKKQTRDLKRQI